MPSTLRNAAFAAVLTMASSSYAAPVFPVFTDFGSLPEATFGGTDIPNDAVAISEFAGFSGDTITLGIAATPRFLLTPPVLNDGAGTFFVEIGSRTPPGSSFEGAFWNFSFYVDIEGGGSLADYDISLLYDFDPGVGTDDTELGVWDFNTQVGPSAPLVTGFESSQNLMFSFLDDAGVPFITPPAFPTFDPNAVGEYSFALVVDAPGGSEIGRTAINVVATPEPSTMAMFALGGVGVFFVARRRRNVQAEVEEN